MRGAARSTIRVQEPVAFGDVSLAPAELTGMPEAQLAWSMVEHIRASDLGSQAEALGFLRRAFPHSPLTVRVAALAALIGR
jgi:hypothetical protein